MENMELNQINRQTQMTKMEKKSDWHVIGKFISSTQLNKLITSAKILNKNHTEITNVLGYYPILCFYG